MHSCRLFLKLPGHFCWTGPQTRRFDGRRRADDLVLTQRALLFYNYKSRCKNSAVFLDLRGRFLVQRVNLSLISEIVYSEISLVALSPDFPPTVFGVLASKCSDGPGGSTEVRMSAIKT